MLESIERQDHIRFLICARRERTSIINTTLRCQLPPIRKSTLTNVDADYFPCTARRDFNRILAITAAEVDHDLATSVAPDVFAKQLLDLADRLIRAAVAVTRLAVNTDPPQQVVSKRSADDPHCLF